MYERYHIPIQTIQGRAQPVPKFVIVRTDNCMNCAKCEKACIYGVHKRSEQDPRKMADPVNQLCKNCFRCIQDCPQRALSMQPGAEYKTLGRGVWTPLRISTIWGEAETGKIPVLGAGYRGMFAGPGYDGMWTDMSEIVRPTRDGIHGREFISTSVDIGRKPGRLEFDSGGRMSTQMPPILELPVPFVIDVSRLRSLGDGMLTGFARAAKHLGTLMFAPKDSLPKEATRELNSNLVPVYPEGTDVEKMSIPEGARMVELQFTPGWKGDANLFRSRFPDTVLSLRLSAGKGLDRDVLDMVRSKVDVAHVLYDEDSVEQDSTDARHAKEGLRSLHKALVSKSVRDQITVIAGGGIAAAEHVPKTLICGADVVALEKALVIALECRDCVSCSKGSCPINLSSAPAEWVEGRVVNMVGAWRDQLLEVLGAMGLREVRRLRGELGRAIFFEDVEREAFSGINGGAP
jgi:Pyruvate/2-oxoacid:ferredoxin oxidoreductase delta subunit